MFNWHYYINNSYHFRQYASEPLLKHDPVLQLKISSTIPSYQINSQQE